MTADPSSATDHDELLERLDDADRLDRGAAGDRLVDYAPRHGAPSDGPAVPTSTGRRRRAGAVASLALLVPLGALVARLPNAVAVPVFVLVLGGMDIVGGVLAKSWAGGRSIWVLLAGCALFVALFWIYGISLRFGELSTVTIGWVVLITVGDMALDHFHYGVHLPVSKWLAAFAIVGLLGYLLSDSHGAG